MRRSRGPRFMKGEQLWPWMTRGNNCQPRKYDMNSTNFSSLAHWPSSSPIYLSSIAAMRLGMIDVPRGATVLATLVCLLVLSLLQACNGHMIELQASSKECFFEDLNPGDQVCRDGVHEKLELDSKAENLLTLIPLCALADDADIPSRRRRTSGHWCKSDRSQ